MNPALDAITVRSSVLAILKGEPITITKKQEGQKTSTCIVSCDIVNKYSQICAKNGVMFDLPSEVPSFIVC